MNTKPNPEKKLIIEVNGKKFARYPIKTKLIKLEDKNLTELIKKYTKELLKKGDILFIAEKIVAINQGRAYPVKEIEPSKMAVFLSKYVYKNPGGIGLASPETMQLAIEEVGPLRILLAAGIGGLAKLFKIKGVFYKIAGDQARGVDGPVPYAIPPYNKYASKAPKNPKKVAKQIANKTGCPVVIVDANDLGVRILGASPEIKKRTKKIIAKALKDNPLGQSDESTPMGILREIKNKK